MSKYFKMSSRLVMLNFFFSSFFDQDRSNVGLKLGCS